MRLICIGCRLHGVIPVDYYWQKNEVFNITA